MYKITRDGETGIAADHWCRSVDTTGAAYFRRVQKSGSASRSDVYYSWGEAPGFAV